MAKLACRACGRQVDTATSPGSPAVEEGRCPRCGAHLEPDRRVEDRRMHARRVNPDGVPGPPAGIGERRVADRRVARRRRAETGGWRRG